MDKPLRASGKISFHKGVSDSTTLFGFFHSAHSMWVNPAQNHGYPMSFFGFALEGTSAHGFFVYPGYRMHGDGENGRPGEHAPVIYPDGAAHEWTLEYQPPESAGAAGKITVSLDGKTTTLDVPAEHLEEGAIFDRFGFVTPWIDGNGQRVYLDDITFTEKQ